MKEKVFLAGATGVIGRTLIPLLIDAGYAVYGTTRRAERAGQIEDAGAVPVIVDVFDAAALSAQLVAIKPQAVLHQLTDLPPALDPARMAQAAINNARIRSVGTRNLVAAATAAGCARMVAQSIAWAYRPGTPPYVETDPLDLDAPAPRSTSVQGVVALEQAVLNATSLIGTVLRYGHLYGPGTGSDTPAGASPLHVHDAACAALLALRRSVGGIYNIAADGGEVSIEKARRSLGWQATMQRMAAS